MQDQELAATTLEVRILCSIIVKAARRSLEERLAASGVEGVGALQFGVLRLLSYQQFTISELSRRMNLKPATLVPVVDALERQGLALRGQDPADRRRTPLMVTPKGLELVARVPNVDPHDAVAVSLDGLQDEGCERFLHLLRSIVLGLPGGESNLREIQARVHPSRPITDEDWPLKRA
jgi:DNA-binding MarR family transcriptional regulator